MNAELGKINPGPIYMGIVCDGGFQTETNYPSVPPDRLTTQFIMDKAYNMTPSKRTRYLIDRAKRLSHLAKSGRTESQRSRMRSRLHELGEEVTMMGFGDPDYVIPDFGRTEDSSYTGRLLSGVWNIQLDTEMDVAKNHKGSLERGLVLGGLFSQITDHVERANRELMDDDLVLVGSVERKLAEAAKILEIDRAGGKYDEESGSLFVNDVDKSQLNYIPQIAPDLSENIIVFMSKEVVSAHC